MKPKRKLAYVNLKKKKKKSHGPILWMVTFHLPSLSLPTNLKLKGTRFSESFQSSIQAFKLPSLTFKRS